MRAGAVSCRGTARRNHFPRSCCHSEVAKFGTIVPVVPLGVTRNTAHWCWVDGYTVFHQEIVPACGSPYNHKLSFLFIYLFSGKQKRKRLILLPKRTKIFKNVEPYLQSFRFVPLLTFFSSNNFFLAPSFVPMIQSGEFHVYLINTIQHNTIIIDDAKNDLLPESWTPKITPSALLLYRRSLIGSLLHSQYPYTHTALSHDHSSIILTRDHVLLPENMIITVTEFTSRSPSLACQGFYSKLHHVTQLSWDTVNTAAVYSKQFCNSMYCTCDWEIHPDNVLVTFLLHGF